MIIGCEERMCTKCLSTFALDQFATAKKGKFGRMSICRKCFHDIITSRTRNHFWGLYDHLYQR